MQVADELGLSEDEQVVRAGELDRPVGEARAAERRLGEPVALNQRAHRAVEDQDPAVEEGAEPGCAVWTHVAVMGGSTRGCAPLFHK